MFQAALVESYTRDEVSNMVSLAEEEIVQEVKRAKVDDVGNTCSSITMSLRTSNLRGCRMYLIFIASARAQ